MTTQSPSQELSTNLPTWFLELQESAQEEYQNTPTPTRSNQNWRFGDLKQLTNIQDYTPAAFEDSENIDIQVSGLETTSAQFIFANDSLVHAEADLPDSVICLPLEDALEKHPDLVQKHLLQNEPTLGSAKYAALHKANLTSGLFVYVPKGIEIQHPIEVYHIVSGQNNAIFPHTLIITEDNAKVTVIDYFKSADDQPGLVIAMNDLITGTGSQLNYTAIQDLNLESKIIQINSTDGQIFRPQPRCRMGKKRIPLHPSRKRRPLRHALTLHPRRRTKVRPENLPTPRCTTHLLRPPLQKYPLRHSKNHLLRSHRRRRRSTLHRCLPNLQKPPHGRHHRSKLNARSPNQRRPSKMFTRLHSLSYFRRRNLLPTSSRHLP